MSVAVRPAVPGDLDDLVELEQLFPSDRIERASLARLIGRDSAAVLVATGPAGEVIGDAIVLLRRGFRSARLYSMVVAPAWRGHGVAVALLRAAEAAARRRGYAQVRLEVRDDNTPAINLYRSHGYHVVGNKQRYYEDESAALQMSKDIADESLAGEVPDHL